MNICAQTIGSTTHCNVAESAAMRALAHAQAIGSNHSPQRGRISSNAVIGSRDIISLVG